MKNLFFCFVLSLAFPTVLISQNKPEATNSDNARAVRKGDNTINIYYGTNVLGTVYKRVATSAAEDLYDLKVKSIGPIGIVYEHLVTDVVGLGAEFGYSSTSINFMDNSSYYDPQTQTHVPGTYNYELKFTTVRIMFRANFHFVKSENFDAYGLVSAGYRMGNLAMTTNNPYDNVNFSYNSVIPFGVKPGIGIRYFFHPNVGINVEFAAGTPLICGGLSFKF